MASPALIPRGGSELEDNAFQGSGCHGAYYYHEINGLQHTSSTETAAATATATETDLSSAFAGVTTKIGSMWENLHTGERFITTTTDLSTVERGKDGTEGQAIAVGHVIKYINNCVQVNGAVTDSNSNTTITVDVGAATDGYFDLSGTINFGLLFRRESGKADNLIFVYGSDNASASDFLGNLNYAGNVALASTGLDDDEWLICVDEKFDDPREEVTTTHSYGINNWTRFKTNGDLSIESDNEKVEIMSNENGTEKLLNKYENFAVTGEVVSILTKSRMNYETEDLTTDSNNDQKTSVDNDLYEEPKKFYCYVKSLDNQKRGYLFAVQDMESWTDTFTEDQTTFPVNLKNVTAEEFGGIKGVKYIQRVS